MQLFYKYNYSIYGKEDRISMFYIELLFRYKVLQFIYYFISSGISDSYALLK